MDKKVENIPNIGKPECVDGDGDMEKSNDGDVEKANHSDSDIEKVLRMAGLLSDSPPNSPERNDASVENSSLKGEADLVHTETKEMQDRQRRESDFECIGSDRSESERNEGKLDNNVVPRFESSVSGQKEDLGMPKDNSVVVKMSENEALDGKKASDGETGDTKNCDKNKNANMDSNVNTNREDWKDECESEGESCAGSKSISHNKEKLSCSPTHSMVCENAPEGEKPRGPVNQKPSDSAFSISKKVNHIFFLRWGVYLGQLASLSLQNLEIPGVPLQNIGEYV